MIIFNSLKKLLEENNASELDQFAINIYKQAEIYVEEKHALDYCKDARGIPLNFLYHRISILLEEDCRELQASELNVTEERLREVVKDHWSPAVSSMEDLNKVGVVQSILLNVIFPEKVAILASECLAVYQIYINFDKCPSLTNNHNLQLTLAACYDYIVSGNCSYFSRHGKRGKIATEKTIESLLNCDMASDSITYHVKQWLRDSGTCNSSRLSFAMKYTLFDNPLTKNYEEMSKSERTSLLKQCLS